MQVTQTLTQSTWTSFQFRGAAATIAAVTGEKLLTKIQVVFPISCLYTKLPESCNGCSSPPRQNKSLSY